MPAQTAKPKRKPARSSQHLRKCSASGKRNQSRNAGLIGASVGAGNTTQRDNQPPALNLSTHGRTGAHVDLVTLCKGVCLLDTEEKMLQAMEDLLPLVEKNKLFVDNKRWSINSSVAEVFHAFYIKLVQTVKMVSVKIALHNDRYTLLIKEGVYFDVPCPHVPVYFIAALEKKDKDLFDLCFYLVVFLNKNSNIRLWGDANDNYVFDYIDQELEEYKSHGGVEENKKEIEALEKAHKMYDPGKCEATLFHNRIWRARASKRIWLKAFDGYTPKTALQKAIYQWLQLGKELVVAGDSINNYISMPDDLDPDEHAEQWGELPYMPDESVRFVYRNDDPWFATFMNMAETESNNRGSLPFYIDKLIDDASGIAEINNCFPAKLLRFMAKGREIEKKYRPLFADEDKLKKALTPEPKKLIDIL